VVQRPPRVQRPVGRSTTRVPRAGIGALVAATAFILAGCQYLFGMSGMGPPGGAFGSGDPGQFLSFDPVTFGSFEPDFSMPAPSAVFTKGAATVTIDGRPVTLDRLSGMAATYPMLGSEATWTDGKGMYVRYYGSGDSTEPGFVSFDRIRDGSHWTTDDPARCTVVTDHTDRTGIAGTATCTGLRWIDTMGGFGSGGDAYVAGEDPFDAAITFQATP
jgi:hypothetical protein